MLDKKQISLPSSAPNPGWIHLFFTQTIGGSLMSGRSNSDITTIFAGLGAFVNIQSGLYYAYYEQWI